MRIRDLEYKYFRKMRKFKAHYMKARYSGQITGVKVIRMIGITFLLFSTLFATGPSVKQRDENPQVQEEVLPLEIEAIEEESVPLIPTKLPDSSEFGLPTAKSALVIDTQTETILYQKQEDLSLPPASLTKIMAALIVLESFDLDEVVTVPGRCIGLAGNNFGFVSGENATVEELLLAMLLGSDSDATCALALYKTSLEEFVLVMNAKVKELGLEKTNFTNPIGLHDENHYSSSNDLIKLAKEALENSSFKEIVQTGVVDIKGKKVENTNDLLFKAAGVTGVKTGYTKEALGCLLISANRGGHEILAVLLGSKDRFTEMNSLINWIYRVYKWPVENAT